jgi:hypothetical protein
MPKIIKTQPPSKRIFGTSGDQPEYNGGTNKNCANDVTTKTQQKYNKFTKTTIFPLLRATSKHALKKPKSKIECPS